MNAYRLLLRTLLCWPVLAAAGMNDTQWPYVGGDAGGQRWSPLADIRRDNVQHLKPAWTYRHGDFSKGDAHLGPTAFQATPLLVDGRLFFCTPYNRVVALDPASGRQLWRFDPKVNLEGVYSPVCRGVSYWRDARAVPGAACAERIYTGTVDARLIAIDARTGRRCEGFGRRGEIDLRQGLGSVQPAEYYMTSPPQVIRDRVITGAFVKDGQRTTAPGGALRAFDARTGELSWVWDPVPPGMKPVTAERLKAGITLTPGTPNVWALMSADPELGLVYAPTGNAAPDHYGGAERQGLDYYAASIVALDAETGALRWRFQTVHHDLWDYDVAAQPVLFTQRVGGKEIPALVAATKLGFVFVLDRRTGQPLFPVEERPVPQSTLPGEHSAPTQPFPVKPAPLHPLTLKREDLWGLSFWDRGRCQKAFDALDYQGVFTPPSLKGTLQYPGLGGGINWGSVSVDPQRNRLVVNLQAAPFVIRAVPRKDYRGSSDVNDLVGLHPQQGTPWVTVREPFLSPLKTPCVPPPWGRLVALDLNSGDKLWERTLGNLHGMAPFGEHFDTGTPNSGGSLQTGGGLVFIAATMDKYLRAFDADSGTELWRHELPYAAHATPMTYRAGGRQYLVIGAGGHGALGTETGDAIVAFTLE